MSIKNIIGATVVSLLLVCVVCGCRTEKTEAEETKQQVTVKINIDKSDKVYSASMAYYCDGEHCGSPTVINASGSVLSGDYYFSFIPEDFPDGHIPADFSFELFVNDSINSGSTASISRSAGKIDLGRVEYGKTYDYKLQGDFKEGFGLKAK